jgi:hypothetical protein
MVSLTGSPPWSCAMTACVRSGRLRSARSSSLPSLDWLSVVFSSRTRLCRAHVLSRPERQHHRIDGTPSPSGTGVTAPRLCLMQARIANEAHAIFGNSTREGRSCLTRTHEPTAACPAYFGRSEVFMRNGCSAQLKWTQALWSWSFTTTAPRPGAL